MTTLLNFFQYSFFLVVAVLGFMACQADANTELTETRQRPNIVVILADDLGYGDLSCYGSQSIETPNLDRLAGEGIRFTRFYSGSAVCSPSRACLLTGKFPLRYDIRQHLRDSTDYLVPESVTLPEILQSAGYATAHIGKWHLGGLRPIDIEQRQAGKTALPGPLQHGFDYYLANIEGAPIRPRLIEQRQLYRGGGSFMLENDKKLPPNPKHWEEIKVEKAIELMDRWKLDKKPFFLNMCFDAPHTPYEPAPEPHLSKYAKLGVSGDQLLFRSMVSHLDANVGWLVDALKERGMYENTLILFASDNGPAFQGSPGPFKGGKTDLHEGGIRVPAFVIWPGFIQPDTHTFEAGHMADFLPTVCEAVGVTIPSDIDGTSMLPLLKAEADTIDRQILLWQMDLYQSFQNQGPKPKPYVTTVATKGFWKMTADGDEPKELFNLAQDHRELYNLLGTEPDIEQELAAAISRFIQAPRLKYDERLGLYEHNQ
jgi:N-acetylgalactosamine-6-sulfatase